MKKYTKTQIQESIKYWQKQLKAGNYKRMNESTQLQEASSTKKLVQIVIETHYSENGFSEHDDIPVFFIESNIENVIKQSQSLKYENISEIKIYDVVASADVCNEINEIAVEFINAFNDGQGYINIPVGKYKKYFPNLETIDINEYLKFIDNKIIKNVDPIFGIKFFKSIKLDDIKYSGEYCPWYIYIMND